MRRSGALATGVAGMVAVATMAASATTPPAPDMPRVVCSHRVTDIGGDAAPDYVGGGTTSSVIGTNPALDILGIDLRVTADQLQVFLAVKRIPDAASMAPYEASYRYLVNFKYSGKLFTYGDEWRNPNQPAQPLDGSSYPTMNMGTGGNDLPGSTATFYPGVAPSPSYLVFTSPRARIEKNLGDTSIAVGDKFSDIYALTQVWISQQKAKADETTMPAAQAVYSVGDDYCFGPPPTTLTLAPVPSVQWGDHATLRASVLDEQGAGIAGKAVEFTIADGKSTVVRATTNASGVAVADYRPATTAGTFGVTARFGGDAAAAPSSASGTVVVKAEATVFAALQVAKPSATSRVVTAILRDDDKTPVPGQKVVWFVNGNQVAATTTDSLGRAILRTAKPGQTVQVRFTGLIGHYLAATSKSARV